MGFGTNIMKSLMFIFNGIVWVLGLVLFVVGIVVLVEGENWNDIIDNKTVPVSVLLIVVGLVIAIVGFLGCFGAMKQNTGMLLIYAVVLGIIILVQLVAGILAFIFSDEAHDFVQEGLTKGLHDYGVSDSLTKAVDWMQEEYECCGVTTYLDYSNGTVAQYWVEEANNGADVPDSCCVVYTEGCGEGGIADNSNVWDDDCYTKGTDYLLTQGIMVGLVGIGVIILEVVVLLLTFKLREATLLEKKKRKSKRNKKNIAPHEQ